jgi:hypothetical protein
VGGAGNSLVERASVPERERDFVDEVFIVGVDGREIFGKQGVAEMKWTS